VSDLFVENYLAIKWLHLIAVAAWFWSTSVAYSWYVVPAYRAFHKKGNAENRSRLIDAMVRFDRGAVLEHIAFPTILVTGLIMVWAGGWSMLELSWLGVKLLIVVGVFIPMELVDFWLAHGPGNKDRILRTGDDTRMDKALAAHWKFFRLTTPIVITMIPATMFLAVVKPF